MTDTKTDHDYTLPKEHQQLLALIKKNNKVLELQQIPYGDNAFLVLGALRFNLTKGGWSREDANKAIALCMTGDYERLQHFTSVCLFHPKKH